MSEAEGRKEYPYSFPSGQEVQEYNYHVEYQWAAAYEELMNKIKEEGTSVGEYPITFQQFKACLNAGVFKLVHVETSDDERYFLCKYWAALEERYKDLEDLDGLDTHYLLSNCRTLWSWN